MSHGTLLAQRARQLVEAHVRSADGRAEVRDPERREVVRVDRAVDLGPRGVDDAFVGGAECVQQRDRFVTGCLVDGELDVRQHPVGVRVGDEQRTALAGGRRGELVTVDQADTGLDRIDAESRPGHVEERHRRSDVAVDVVTCEQVPNRALEHERRPGDRVQDLTVFGSGRSERVGDLAVHVVERVGGVIEVVERGGVGHQVGRRVHRRAQVAVGGPLDRRSGLDGHVVVATGAESDDDDPWSLDLAHGQLSGTTWPVVASKVP